MTPLARLVLESRLSWALSTKAGKLCSDPGKPQFYKGHWSWSLLKCCARIRKTVKSWNKTSNKTSSRCKSKPIPNNLSSKGAEQVNQPALWQPRLSISPSGPLVDKAEQVRSMRILPLGCFSRSPVTETQLLHQRQESGQEGLWSVSCNKIVWMMIFFPSFSSSKLPGSQRLL